MRFFIALEIPSKNRLQIQTIQENLQKFIPQARLTNLRKINLTLAFLGEQVEIKSGPAFYLGKFSNGQKEVAHA